jgi:hypothetical protein
MKKEAPLANVQVGDLRGHAVLAFDKAVHPDIDPDLGMNWYADYPSEVGDLAGGVSCCGLYDHDTAGKMKGVFATARQGLRDHAGHGDSPAHLHFVYYQQTVDGKDIKKATKEKMEKSKYEQYKPLTGGARANLDYFLDEIRRGLGRDPLHSYEYKGGASAEFVGGDVRIKLPNVISHDFVKDTTCKKIVSLNEDLAGLGWG